MLYYNQDKGKGKLTMEEKKDYMFFIYNTLRKGFTTNCLVTEKQAEIIKKQAKSNALSNSQEVWLVFHKSEYKKMVKESGYWN